MPPNILPAHILVTGHVVAVEPEISSFIINLRQSFLDEPILTFLAIHIFFARESGTVLHMPSLGDILTLKARVLSIEDDRFTVVLDKLTSLR